VPTTAKNTFKGANGFCRACQTAPAEAIGAHPGGADWSRTRPGARRRRALPIELDGRTRADAPHAASSRISGRARLLQCLPVQSSDSVGHDSRSGWRG
jgi:hypothetical protein